MKAAVVLPLRGNDLSPSVPAARHDGGLLCDAIRGQLTKILNSNGFVRAQRMQRFLGIVVEETLAGRSGQLCEYSIGISVFGRSESFEPGLDPIVRNDARRLRQKLLEYYQLSRRRGSDEVVIDMPKGKLRSGVQAEFTASQIAPRVPVDDHLDANHRRRRDLDNLLRILIVISTALSVRCLR